MSPLILATAFTESERNLAVRCLTEMSGVLKNSLFKFIFLIVSMMLQEKHTVRRPNLERSGRR